MEPLDRQSLIEGLAHGDEEIRRLAVERLSLLPAAEAVPHLVERLGDPSWRVRKAAVERLIAQDDAGPAVAALVAALADGENPGRRNAALEALTRFGSTAVPLLVEASHDADVDVRKQVVDALGAIGDSAAADRMVQLLGDPDPNVRGAAAEALGGLGARGVEPLLLACVENGGEPLVQLSALRSLAKLRASVPVARLAPALADPLLRPAAFAVLGASDDPTAWDTLVKGLTASARSSREAAMEALVGIASQTAPGAERALVERLRESTGDASFLADALARLASAPLTTRLVLVQFLGLLGRSDCVVPLLEASADEALAELATNALAAEGAVAEAALAGAWAELDEGVRLRGCALLARTAGPAGEELLRRALGAADPRLRATAARALAERRSAAALPALVAALALATAAEPVDLAGEADEAAALEAAIGTLVEASEGPLGDRAAALLEAQAEGAAEGFRVARARLLGRFGSGHHVAQVELLCSDPSAAVRRAAVEALARLAPARVEPLRCALADEAPLVRAGAAAALAASGDPGAVADLAALGEDGDPRVVAAALRALAIWARAVASEPARERALLLLSVGLANGGMSALAALDALATLGGADAVGLAQGALASPDPEVVEAAVACVGRHGSRDDLGRLLDYLGHPHWSIRARTVQVMQERRHVRAIPAILRHLEAEQDEFVREAALAALRTLESH
jgi:HEAT repeat protein